MRLYCCSECWSAVQAEPGAQFACKAHPEAPLHTWLARRLGCWIRDLIGWTRSAVAGSVSIASVYCR